MREPTASYLRQDVTEAHLATYRANVANYLESRSAKWKEQAR